MKESNEQAAVLRAFQNSCCLFYYIYKEAILNNQFDKTAPQIQALQVIEHLAKLYERFLFKDFKRFVICDESIFV